MASRTYTLLSGVSAGGAGSELDVFAQPGRHVNPVTADITISGTATVAIEYHNGSAWQSAGSVTATGQITNISIPHDVCRVRANVTSYTSGTVNATITISFKRGGDPNY